VRAWPSRTLRTVNSLERAFTAFTPTPFSPTDLRNVVLSSNLPPVFIFDTASESLLSGMPRP